MLIPPLISGKPPVSPRKTRQPQKERGRSAKVKKIATFFHGGGKVCFLYSNLAWPSWDMAPMQGEGRVFMSQTPQQHREVVGVGLH